MFILFFFSLKKIFFKIFSTLDHGPQKYGVLLYVKCKVFINIYKTCDIYWRHFVCACVYMFVYIHAHKQKSILLWSCGKCLFFYSFLWPV